MMNEMNEELENYCEQEGISKDDIINKEIEEEHKEAAARKAEQFHNECQALADDIKKKQQERLQYFREVGENKHEGKMLYNQKIEIEFWEVIDYDKTKLVYEATDEDVEKNANYLDTCSSRIDKAALQFAKAIQDNEKYNIHSFDIERQQYEMPQKPNCNVTMKCFDAKAGKFTNLSDVPPEVLKILLTELSAAISNVEGEGEQKKEAEAEPATV